MAQQKIPQLGALAVEAKRGYVAMADSGSRGIQLDKLVYDDNVSGTLRLYVYDVPNPHPGGTYPHFHSGGTWFARTIRYPNEEITLSEARKRAEDAIVAGHEVRITNGSDFLVFHARAGSVVFPAYPDEFWGKACR